MRGMGRVTTIKRTILVIILILAGILLVKLLGNHYTRYKGYLKGVALNSSPPPQRTGRDGGGGDKIKIILFYYKTGAENLTKWNFIYMPASNNKYGTQYTKC